jgi:hypothetical protein
MKYRCSLFPAVAVAVAFGSMSCGNNSASPRPSADDDDEASEPGRGGSGGSARRLDAGPMGGAAGGAGGASGGAGGSGGAGAADAAARDVEQRPEANPDAAAGSDMLEVGVDAPTRPAAGFVKISEIATYQGQPTLKIETGTGAAVDVTYYYHKLGAGFASIIDRDGKDWITWKPGGGPDGEYRGIPNLGVERCCHPGYGVGSTRHLAMQTSIVEEKPSSAIIKSVGAGFEVRWAFSPTHATLTVAMASKAYWFLYEGTPGGAIESGDQLVFLSNGHKIPISNGTYSLDMPDPEWVFFADSKLDRSLFFAHHEADTHRDTYYRMGSGSGGMTVWGFGRGQGTTTLLTGRNHLTIGLIESRDFDTIKMAVTRAVQSE